jgi:hypothetical protein
MFISLNGNPKSYSSFSKERKVCTYPLTLGARTPGADYGRLRIAQVLIYGRALNDSEISSFYASNIVYVNNLRLFLDPTFFNGTHFIDFSGNNNHGKGYNGVQRVPAENIWLYHIKGLNADGSIRLRFIPKNSEVIIANGTGTVLRLFIGEEAKANDAGMVEDIVLPIEPGNYTVTLRVYQPQYKSVNVESQQLKNPVIIPLVNLSIPVSSANVAVYVRELSSWHPAYLISVNDDEKFLVLYRLA